MIPEVAGSPDGSMTTYRGALRPRMGAHVDGLFFPHIVRCLVLSAGDVAAFHHHRYPRSHRRLDGGSLAALEGGLKPSTT
jgi:hypothetical protein